MNQGALSFGDDVVGDTSSPQMTNLESHQFEARTVDDIGEDGQGDQDTFHDGPQGCLDISHVAVLGGRHD